MGFIERAKAKLKPDHESTKVMLKAMGLMGSFKALYILCALIRNKLIALWVGPAGVGISILYNSILEMVGQTTRMNIDQSAVRDIAASGKGQLDSTATVVGTWSVGLGVLGALVVCLLSPLLSIWSFGDTHMWWSFCVLSLVPMGNTIFNGVQAILQGTGQNKRIAQANILVVIGAIILVVPLVYFLREDSIIWVILVYGVFALISAIVFRPGMRRVVMGLREIWRRGASFIKLGVLITVANGVSMLFNYLFVLYMNSYASTDTLGIYQAGYTLVNTYVGMLFAGLWMDFFPRLSALSHTRMRASTVVSHQMNVTVWLLMPLVAFFVAADELVVIILYADTFMAMLPFITLGIAGVVIRGASWCIAYVMLTRGDGHMYVITETVSGVVFLVLHVLMYSAWGFLGLGFAYILWYAIYFSLCYVIYRRRYGLTLDRGVMRSLILSITFCLIAVAAKYLAGWWLPLLMAIAIVPSTLKRLK